jgi:hypothetical protein
VPPNLENLVKRANDARPHGQRNAGLGILNPRRQPLASTPMRISPVLIWAMAGAACSATAGDVFRTRMDGGSDADAALSRPRPVPLATWQIQLTGALDTSVDVAVLTADLETSPATIARLHGAGRVALCYFSAGTMEPFRDDAGRFPSSALGSPLPAYPDERWIDPRDVTVRAIMRDRMAAAAERGCDGVHPSGLGAFTADTGFGLSRDDQLNYNRWLAAAAHEQGLSIGLVEGDSGLRQELLPDFDWAVVFSCLDSNCPAADPFVKAGKAAFLIEYGDGSRAADVCPRARTLGLSAVIKRDSNLDAFRGGCP